MNSTCLGLKRVWFVNKSTGCVYSCIIMDASYSASANARGQTGPDAFSCFTYHGGRFVNMAVDIMIDCEKEKHAALMKLFAREPPAIEKAAPGDWVAKMRRTLAAGWMYSAQVKVALERGGRVTKEQLLQSNCLHDMAMSEGTGASFNQNAGAHGRPFTQGILPTPEEGAA